MNPESLERAEAEFKALLVRYLGEVESKEDREVALDVLADRMRVVLENLTEPGSMMRDFMTMPDRALLPGWKP